MQNYSDFDLQIGLRQGEAYPVTVYGADGGDASGVLRLPFSIEDIPYERSKIAYNDERALRSFGKALFDALFSGKILECYRSSQALAKGHGLRVRLLIDPPELTILPWELLFDRSDFLALSTGTSIVRYIKSEWRRPPREEQEKLRILAVVANPSDKARLNVQAEKQRLATSLEPLIGRKLVELRWVDEATSLALQRALWEGPWHAFHFIGHGEFDLAADEGRLFFCDEAGRADPVSATHLVRLLAYDPLLRLVVLNACQSAAGGRDTSSSVANMLALRGLPAVVAMQFPLSDDAAVEFSRVFYLAMASGLPVDKAVAEARKHLAKVSGGIAWATPIIAMRASDGRLFELAPPRADRRATSSGADGRLLALLAEGNAFFESREYQRALTSYEQVIVLDSSYAEAYYRRGRTRYRLGDDTAALADFERAIALDPLSSLAYCGRGSYRHNNQDYEGAVADYEQAIRLDPNNGFAFAIRGLLKRNQQRYDDALADLERALLLNPRDTLALAYRGLVHADRKQFDAAYKDFDRALSLDHKQAEAYFHRAQLAATQEQYDQALADYSRYIMLEHLDWRGYFKRGEVYLSRRQFPEAEADFLKAITYAKQSLEPLLYLGFLRMEQERYAEAEALFDQVLQRDETYYEAHWARGAALEEQAKLNEALAAYNQAIALNPKFVAARSARASLFWRHDRLPEALTEYTWLVEHTPSDEKALLNRAGVQWDLGALPKALEDYTQAVTIAPGYARGYRARGRLYDELKQYSNALRDLRRAVELEPERADNYYYLAKVLVNCGKYVDSITPISTAIEKDPDNDLYYYQRAVPRIEMAERATSKTSKLPLLRGALNDMNKALQLKQNAPDYLERRARIHHELENYAKAVADLQLALKHTSDLGERKRLQEQVDKAKRKERFPWLPF